MWNTQSSGIATWNAGGLGFSYTKRWWRTSRVTCLFLLVIDMLLDFEKIEKARSISGCPWDGLDTNPDLIIRQKTSCWNTTKFALQQYYGRNIYGYATIGTAEVSRNWRGYNKWGITWRSISSLLFFFHIYFFLQLSLFYFALSTMLVLQGR